jgi:ABC-type lipoprotein export system ATPase subunit
MRSGTPAIELVRLVKDYRGLRPLRIAALSVSAGERVALSGVDAAGAEMLVNLITGAALPDQGDVLLAGSSTAAITDGDAWLASLDRFGIVSERAVMLESATLLQNLALPLSLAIDAVNPEVKRRAESLAGEVGLGPDRLDARTGEAPAPDRLRAQVARALALDPAVLLLEHPTASLPRDAVESFARDVSAVAERRAIAALAITEDEVFASLFASRWLRVQAASGALAPARAKRRWFG